MALNDPTPLAAWKLRLPPVDHFKRLPSQVSLARSLRRADGATMEMRLPFFWFDPQWHRYPVDRCQLVEQAVAKQDVFVSALQRDLSQDDAQPAGDMSRRIVPHRPDRAGLIHFDLAAGAVIELRLLSMPNRFGALTYEASQWSRWKNVELLSHPIAASAMMFPPEWRSLSDVHRKVEQLRMLGHASILLSLDLEHLDRVLPQLVNAGLDGVIVRTANDPLVAIQKTTQAIQKNGLSLWIWLVSDQTRSADEIVKCLAMGASGIAIDSICNQILSSGETLGLSDSDLAAVRMGYASESASAERFYQAAEFAIGQLATETRGLMQACGVASLDHLNQANLEPVPR